MAAALSAEEGFVPLFDGKTLDGWFIVNKQGPGYAVENGILVCPADGGQKLFTEKQYSNFTLRFEFKLEPDSNNGIAIRAPRNGHTSTQGIEIQILDQSGPKYSQQKLRPEQYHGSVYDVIPARTGFLEARRVAGAGDHRQRPPHNHPAEWRDHHRCRSGHGPRA